jgi:hypothetical protein
METTPLAADHLNNPQQYNGANQGDQHGWDGNGFIDRSHTQQWADEITSQKGADNAHDNIEQQTLLRIRTHNPAGDITYNRSGYEIDDNVHFLSFI